MGLFELFTHPIVTASRRFVCYIRPAGCYEVSRRGFSIRRLFRVSERTAERDECDGTEDTRHSQGEDRGCACRPPPSRLVLRLAAPTP